VVNYHEVKSVLRSLATIYLTTSISRSLTSSSLKGYSDC